MHANLKGTLPFRLSVLLGCLRVGAAARLLALQHFEVPPFPSLLSGSHGNFSASGDAIAELCVLYVSVSGGMGRHPSRPIPPVAVHTNGDYPLPSRPSDSFETAAEGPRGDVAWQA